MKNRKCKITGRPRADDPRVHIPNVVIRQSVLLKMIKLAKGSNKYLSYHVEKAFDLYLKSPRS